MPALVRLLTVVAAIVGVAAFAEGATRPAPCPAARYDVAGDLLGAGSAGGATLDVGAEVAIRAACGAAPSRTIRGTRAEVTTLRARWRSCAGVTGPVTLKARIVDECTHVVGTVRAGGQRRALDAVRSDCGDGILDATPPATPYLPTRPSLDAHPLPPWFDDAKFGIMIHWGIFTIPAWAELTIDAGEWLCCGRLLDPPDYGREFFTHIPYVEWYSNTILIDGSPAQQHHAATYGANFPYENFRPQFETAAAAFSADAWADLFRDAGARYVVLVTKHHDGFALWPTAVPHPTRPGWHLARDVVGELNASVRKRCMRMGLYYSGGFDWSVQPGPVQTSLDALTVSPNTPEYIAYADGQWRELIARYHPAVLWNDITYPAGANVLSLFADYYNAVPDGVVNDRFTILPGLTHADFSTPEFSVVADISATKFETVRGMGHGFGFNQNETDADYTSSDDLIRLLVDVVSKNGNLLLNVGPMADGTVPAAQVARLHAIGDWLRTNGEAIYGTRPWTRAEGITGDGTPVRFTASGDGRTVYAAVQGPLPAGTVALVGIGDAPLDVRLLGAPGRLHATTSGADVVVTLPQGVLVQPTSVFALRMQR